MRKSKVKALTNDQLNEQYISALYGERRADCYGNSDAIGKAVNKLDGLRQLMIERGMAKESKAILINGRYTILDQGE